MSNDPQAPEAPATAPTRLEDVKPKMKLTGTVKKVELFGAFVDVGVGRDGLLHISALGPNRTLIKVLESAVANAEQKQAIPENLVVSRAWVDEGPTLRRFRPRAYGRANRIRKRTSHVTVVVQSFEEVSGGAQG